MFIFNMKNIHGSRQVQKCLYINYSKLRDFLLLPKTKYSSLKDARREIFYSQYLDSVYRMSVL